MEDEDLSRKKLESKPESMKPDTIDDIKTLPMPELLAKLGSSPDGLSQVETQKRLAEYGPEHLLRQDGATGAGGAQRQPFSVRGALITDSFSAHQGVEDDDMNVMCLGGRATGSALSWDLVQTFLNARFKGDERFRRRLEKVAAIERERAHR